MNKFSLTALSRTQLEAARQSPHGRSSHTVYGGHEHVLRQTIIALVAGAGLAGHESPGEATLHVLHGRVRLTVRDTTWDGSAGDYLIIAPERHRLDATQDCVVLLTVAISR